MKKETMSCHSRIISHNTGLVPRTPSGILLCFVLLNSVSTQSNISSLFSTGVSSSNVVISRVSAFPRWFSLPTHNPHAISSVHMDTTTSYMLWLKIVFLPPWSQASDYVSNCLLSISNWMLHTHSNSTCSTELIFFPFLHSHTHLLLLLWHLEYD